MRELGGMEQKLRWIAFKAPVRCGSMIRDRLEQTAAQDNRLGRRLVKVASDVGWGGDQ